MKKRLLAGILAFVLVFSLTGCGGNKSAVQMNDDGSIKAYTEEEIPEGLYVKSGDNFYPLLNANPKSEMNYQWFTEFDQLIPELKEGDTLILYSEEEVPESFVFWKMIDFGYTVGIKFTQTKSGKDLAFPGAQDGYCEYSPVGDYVLKNALKDANPETVRIKEVNGKEFKETMLTTDGFMKGLTKDAMYKFWYYQGTVYKSVNIKADTHVFIEDYELSTASYIELKDKVFEVNLPSGIENGYWYVDGYGMFEYNGPDTDLILDPDEYDKEDLMDEPIVEEPSESTTPTEQPPVETQPSTQPTETPAPEATTPPAENPNPQG